MGETIFRQLNIYVQSGDAQEAYDNLEKKNKSLEKSVESLMKKQKQADEERKKGNKEAELEYKALGEEINRNKKKIEDNTSAMDRQAKKISGELSPSLRDLNASLARLTAEQKKASEQDPGFAERAKQITEYRNAIDQAKNSTGLIAAKFTEAKNRFGEFISDVKKIAAGVLIGNTVQAIAENVIGSIQNTFSQLKTAYIERKQATSELSAVTGATGKDLDYLKSAAVDLKEIYVDSGKAIISSSIDITKAFTIVGSAAPELLKNLPALKAVTREAIILAQSSGMTIEASANAITATMNEFNLAADQSRRVINVQAAGQKEGAARISETVESLQNLGPVLNNYNISLEQGIALIQTLSLKNIKGAEAGTMLREVVLKLAKEGIGYKNGIFDINFALDEMRTKHNNNADMLKIFGERATVGGSILVEMQDKYKSMTTAITGTNEAYSQAATMLIDLEVAQKRFSAASGESQKALSEKLVPWMIKAYTAGYDFLQIIKDPSAMAKFYNWLIILASAYVAYSASVIASNIAILYNTVVTTANAVAKRTAAIATNLYTLAVNLLSGNITIATVATQVWAAATATATGGLTLIIGALAAVGGALLVYLNTQRESVRISKLLADVQLEASKSISGQKAELESLLIIAKDVTISDEKRAAAIQKINDLIPDSIGLLTLQNINTQEGIDLINKYTDALERQAMAEALKSAIKEKYIKLFALQTTKLGEDASVLAKTADFIDYMTQGKGISHVVDERKKNEEAIRNEIKAMADLYKEKVKNGEVDVAAPDKNNFGNLAEGNPDGDKASKKAEKQHAKDLSEYLKFQEELYHLREQATDKMLNQNQKEIAALAEKYQKEQEKAEHFLNTEISTREQYLEDVKKINEAYALEEAALKEKHNKAFFAKEYEDAIKQQDLMFSALREKYAQDFEHGLITKREQNQLTRQLAIVEAETKLDIANKYATKEFGAVKKAQDDEVKYRKDINAKIIDDVKATAEEIIESEKFIASLKKRQAVAHGNDIIGQMEEELANLKANFEAQKKLHSDNEEEINEITKTYAAEREKIIADSASKVLQKISNDISKYGNMAMNFIGNLAKIQTNQENAELARDKKATDKKIKEYDRQLAQHRISKEVHDRLVEISNEEMAKKEDDLKRKQFQRNKNMQMAQAGINTAVAVTNALSTQPFYVGLAMAFVAAGMGAAEIAAIQSEEYVSSYGDGTRSFADGTRSLDGEAHSGPNGGNPIIDPTTGRIIAKIERGEAIIPQDATARNPQVIEMLLGPGRNRNITSLVTPAANYNVSRTMDNIRYANGGYYQTSSNTAQNSSTKYVSDNSAMESLLRKNNELMEEQLATSKKTLAKPPLSLQNIDDARRIQNLITQYQLG